jgi:hypothetical protein
MYKVSIDRLYRIGSGINVETVVPDGTVQIVDVLQLDQQSFMEWCNEHHKKLPTVIAQNLVGKMMGLEILECMKRGRNGKSNFNVEERVHFSGQ